MAHYSDMEKKIKCRFDAQEYISDDELAEFMFSIHAKNITNRDSNFTWPMQNNIINEMSIAFLNINKKMYDDIVNVLGFENMCGSIANKIRKYQEIGNKLKSGNYANMIFKKFLELCSNSDM